MGGITSAVAAFFKDVPLQPVTVVQATRALAVAMGVVLLSAAIIPGLRESMQSAGMIFVGAFVGIMVNDAGLSMSSHPKQTVAVIAVVSFVMLAIAAMARGIIIHLSTI